MKRFLFAAVIILGVILVPLFCFAASCESGAEYFIRFTLNGTAYEFSKGSTDIEAAAFGNIINDSVSVIFIGATSDTVSSEEQPENGIMILIVGTTAGTYPLDEISEEASIMILVTGSSGYESGSGSVIVTVVGEVGGVIEGTFSGTVTDSETTVDLTNGSFRVKRIADDTYYPFT